MKPPGEAVHRPFVVSPRVTFALDRILFFSPVNYDNKTSPTGLKSQLEGVINIRTANRICHQITEPYNPMKINKCKHYTDSDVLP